jgi:AcrR family transcriptional regulator
MAELLWDRGYVGTSPAAIIKHTGVGHGSLYHFFSGKQELAVAAFEANANVLKSAAEETLGRPGHAYDRLERFLMRDREVLRGCRIGRLTQDPEVYAIDALRVPVENTLRWLHDELQEVIATGQRAGELADAVDASDLADTIVATLQGGYVIARAERDEERFTGAVRGVLALIRKHVSDRGSSTLPSESAQTPGPLS